MEKEIRIWRQYYAEAFDKPDNYPFPSEEKALAILERLHAELDPQGRGWECVPIVTNVIDMAHYIVERDPYKNDRKKNKKYCSEWAKMLPMFDRLRLEYDEKGNVPEAAELPEEFLRPPETDEQKQRRLAAEAAEQECVAVRKAEEAKQRERVRAENLKYAAEHPDSLVGKFLTVRTSTA